METLSGHIPIKEIFLCREAWISFWISNAFRLRWGILWNVTKMLQCKSGRGYTEYVCPECDHRKKFLTRANQGFAHHAAKLTPTDGVKNH